MDSISIHLYAKFMHLNNLASDISMTALLFIRLFTGTRLVLAPSLLQLINCTSVHVFISLMALSSGSGIAISWSSSSWASASKCDTINWPECMVSRSLLFWPARCLAIEDDGDWFMVRLDDGGGDGLFDPVNQLSRSNCCWCDILFAIFTFDYMYYVMLCYVMWSLGLIFLRKIWCNYHTVVHFFLSGFLEQTIWLINIYSYDHFVYLLNSTVRH